MPSAQSLSGRVRNFANLSKPDIQIHLKNDAHNCRHYINSFSTGDKIQGLVSITAPHDTSFDEIEISLVGSTKAYVDRISPSAAISARSEAFQMFLKVDCPINESDMPDNGTLKADHTYTLPFSFVVPAALPGSCKHKTSTPEVKNLHLHLPPSLGDPEMAGQGPHLMDDCAPEMVRILYVVRTRVLKWRDNQQKKMIISDRSRKIRLVPGFEEQPPVTVNETDEDYCLRTEKGVRKGLLKGKTGRIVAEVSQPKSLHLPGPTQDNTHVTTMASVQLRFDPMQESAEPPKLGHLASKLRVGTFYASTPRANVPNGRSSLIDPTQGLYVDVLNLSGRCLSGTKWTKHEPQIYTESANVRRDSAMSVSIGGSAEFPAPSSVHNSSLPFWTTHILLPISPPRNKILIPSFQSCLASRVYILEVVLNLAQTSSVTLKVPIQITSEGGIAPPPAFEEVAEEIADEVAELERSDSIEQYFTPRRISSPEDAIAPATHRRISSSRRRSEPMAPPPEYYSTFAPRSGGILRSEGTPSLYHALHMVR